MAVESINIGSLRILGFKYDIDDRVHTFDIPKNFPLPSKTEVKE
jgi:hypothetical protein